MSTLWQADVEAITEIEVARLQVDLMACQEKLRRQEETWPRKLAELRAKQEVVLVDLEKADFEIEGARQ